MNITPERLAELQADLLMLAGQLSRLSAGVMQMSAEIPGARVIDMPGAKPRTKPRKPQTGEHHGEEEDGRHPTHDPRPPPAAS